MMDDKRYDPLKMMVKPLTANKFFVWSSEIEKILWGNDSETLHLKMAEQEEESADSDVAASRKRDIALAYIRISIDSSCRASVIVMQDPAAV